MVARVAAMHALLLALALLGAPPPAMRVAVLLDDPGPGAPATAALEAALQRLGHEVVEPGTAARLRPVLAPEALLGARLPEGLSVLEADAVLAGAAAYGAPTTVDGVRSVAVSLTVRVVDLATSEATATLRSEGVGLGVDGPLPVERALAKALERLLAPRGLGEALAEVGQRAGSVVLLVQGLPEREALTRLKAGLERALAGAPVRELYFARGLGKLVLGGGTAGKPMSGPEVADLLAEQRSLGLAVEEVANTRIVARLDRARAVRVHALVLEPRLPRRDRRRAEQLGKYVTTRLATFEFARASYQRGALSREAAVRQARRAGADVLVEPELIAAGDGAALALRVIDVATGRPILRGQERLAAPGAELGAADALLAALHADLPARVLALRDDAATSPGAPAVATGRAEP
jgi:hypothetical protein